MLTVTLSECGTQIAMRDGLWKLDCPVGDLDHWIAFTARMIARGAPKGSARGPWAKFYDADMAALQAAKRQIEARHAA